MNGGFFEKFDTAEIIYYPYLGNAENLQKTNDERKCMPMGMSLSFSLAPQLTQRLEHKQVLAQQLSLSQKLALQIHGELEVYKPKGACPSCSRRLTPAEIVMGFNRNPDDYTTKCPKCKQRFEPRLVSSSSDWGSIEIPFFCQAQTLARLTSELAGVEIAVLKTTYAAIYRSAMYHFGSLKAAFKRVGLKYNLEPRVTSWQKKVYRFLGKLPDSLIASTANVSVREVRKLRQERNVAAYRR
ncbi:MAG: hypothetical protein A3G59_01975 [Candidatus Taylorbacteria bacterium RIFCSPLOWO2_12_FULL_47_20]|uniref:Uncharacterized protein n=2 Tax=Candidatus Tayloriibacteriota TaxID=1817919 RepID=A0A1G2P8S1_9BACT|nr:MAG: hypothetical protein A3H68_02545 [Candidatus Taylorbacteria bacterium RIFCSPLOWO2_02_FULL_46_40]OHA44109.1 MAG: hypothetical protein A3G59_01975 [Candidatus Taylorbacteria bacterium RIFCSPLOWO2_12_FULL_47_20]